MNAAEAGAPTVNAFETTPATTHEAISAESTGVPPVVDTVDTVDTGTPIDPPAHGRQRTAAVVAGVCFVAAAVGLAGTVNDFAPAATSTAVADSPTRQQATDFDPSTPAPDREDRGTRSEHVRRPPIDERPSTASRRTPKPTPTAEPSTPSPAPTPPATPKRIVVPRKASGKLSVASASARLSLDTNSALHEVMSYRVEVEDGLPFEREQFADVVHEKLTDERGWQDIEDVQFRQTDDSDADFRLVLASPDKTDELCAPLETEGKVSCRMGDKVVLNAKRWAFGVPAYDGKLDGYRTYLVNHEVGHRLGHDHADCDTPGEPAPLMMQQTKGVGECVPNPWPSVRAH